MFRVTGLFLLSTLVWAQGPLQFRVSIGADLCAQPTQGRLFVFLSTSEANPMTGPNWIQPEPFFGRDLANFQAGQAFAIDEQADGFPGPLSQLKPGKYRIQALFDHDFYQAAPSDGVGNWYSEVLERELDPAQSGPIDLQLVHTIAAKEFPVSERIQKIERVSPLLSAFNKREIRDSAAVVLPASYASQPERRYPVLYIISGFGGTLAQMAKHFSQPDTGEVEFIRVLLSGQCKWGHHVYADSATNGPRGRVLVEELVPYIDQHFRTVADSRARFVNGHSSGGWSSLWVQVTYPDTFGGVWSSSPDPVDFRDFQQVNLYTIPPLSLYTDPNGQPRPLGRMGETPMLWYPNFAKMDDVLGRGGQLRSFEAVFSPLGADGLPKKCWDRKTGQLDPTVVKTWEAYDISLILRENWPALAPKLKGKLHIVMGELDTFYLEGATKLLKAELEKLGSDAEVTLVPGANHFTVLTPEVRKRQADQMAEAFLTHFNVMGQPAEAVTH
ncbi:MAG: hypothetical protein H6510_12630 [Acidobacteria bacterium]|nr:hypothetical protein [Acidobacteriota bacterium]MCB9398652.1 hypothetical protein [Acidobacteriota bacterium]